MPLDYHRKHRGKIAVEGKAPLEDADDLSKAYTPGVAEASQAIVDDPETVYEYTTKGDMAAVVSNGSAVLGMGDVGAEASIPVMEGKALLIREMGGVSAFPVVLDEEDVDEVVATVERLSPIYGFIMLEDIRSPDCFYAEEVLKERLDVPVFHDDQHGAAIAVLAALTNAMRVVEKEMQDARVAIIGAGAAGIATANLLNAAGIDEIRLVDQQGILTPAMEGLNGYQEQAARVTNPDGEEGDLEDALNGADALIGLSVGGIVSKEMVRSMADDPVIFAMANPDPEILYEDAREAGAAVVGTGRSDFPNQINNSLVFPGIIRGALACNASRIDTEMKLAAAEAIAALVEDPEPERVIPSSLDPDVVDAVAEAVTARGQETGACRID